MTVLDPRTPDLTIWLNPGRVHNLAFTFPEGTLGDYNLSFYFGDEEVATSAVDDQLLVTLSVVQVDSIGDRVEWSLRDATIGILIQGEFYRARGNRVTATQTEIPLEIGGATVVLQLIGPRGFPGEGAQTATGLVAVPNLTWMMTHNLDIPESLFNPADWWFEDENGDPMEPVEVTWLNSNIAIAQWDTPVRGSWIS